MPIDDALNDLPRSKEASKQIVAPPEPEQANKVIFTDAVQQFRNSLQYYLPYQLATIIKSKGLNVTWDNGNIVSFLDNEIFLKFTSIGIAAHKRFWFGHDWIGYLYFNDPNKWKLEVYGRKNIDRLKNLADEISKQYSKDIELILELEYPKSKSVEYAGFI
ncbi:MAG TPA: hypothetical protein VJJ23_06540 [Candidatus Nanoarchaeia archaeon]|nr:hypothetical protein [Candidatus Nanoarchaeia archaeon]